MGDIRILDPRYATASEFKHHQSRPWPSSSASSSMYRNHHHHHHHHQQSNSRSAASSFCYRPLPLDNLHQWISPQEYNYVTASANGRLPGSIPNNSNKSTDYYYLTPLYRNSLGVPIQPPPQALQVSAVPPLPLPPSHHHHHHHPNSTMPPKMLMMQDRHNHHHGHHHRPSRNRSTKSSGSIGLEGRHSVPPCTCAIGRTRSLEDVRSEFSEWEEYSNVNGNRIARSSPKSNGMMMVKGYPGRRSMENLLEVDDDDRCVRSSPRVVRINNDENKSGKRRGSYMVRKIWFCCLQKESSRIFGLPFEYIIL